MGLAEHEAEQDSLQRVAEHLNAAQSGVSVCLICLELLKRKDAVWSCSRGCCDTTHLACIQVWLARCSCCVWNQALLTDPGPNQI